MASLPTIIENIKAIQSELADLKSMKTELLSVKTNLECMKSSIEFAHNSLDVLTSKTSKVELEVEGLMKMETEMFSLRNRFKELESYRRECEQRSRMNNIEFKGVPEAKTENLIEIVSRIGELIAFKIPKEQINYIARVPMRGNNRSKNIICSVHSRYIKVDFVAAAKKHKAILSSNIGLQGDTRIFVNDHLTLDNKLLLNKTKSVAKEQGFAYVWVKSCKILI
ncbi:uncharacterized protein LOC119189193 [Manduca sexta]|uniref:uncharacterized protein LOC119189193 n=1 Tax=Manduca sexta TaxID=7130 RepID=UPI00188ED026|nr:uncharacterized protein LOC119189193 [Manduca sexta]